MTENTQDDGGMMCQVEEQELKGWTMFLDAIVPPSKGDLLEGSTDVESSVRCAKEAERFHNYDSDSEEKEVKCMELLEFDTS